MKISTATGNENSQFLSGYDAANKAIANSVPGILICVPDQLLRRPEALAAAVEAARADDDDRLWKILREAMRFDPLAPVLPRIAAKTWTIAEGTRRARTIPKDATIIAAFASAMMDERRIPNPDRFDPDRLDHEYIHFGHELHGCIGRHI